jgi:hypothetical protein
MDHVWAGYLEERAIVHICTKESCQPRWSDKNPLLVQISDARMCGQAVNANR